MEGSSIILLIMSVIVVQVLDTGQCDQDLSSSSSTTFRDCRSISDGCSCPQTQPHYLRCIGKKDDLETILEHLQKIDYHINMLDITLTNLHQIKQSSWSQSGMNLSALVISSSHLESIESSALTSLKTSLKSLSLPNNSLQSVPLEVFELDNLMRLDLSQNFIQNVNDLSQAEHLEILVLSSNLISDINAMVIPNSLTNLDLTKNKINLEGISAFNFNNLKELDLSHNSLEGKLNQDSFWNNAGENSENSNLKTLDLSFNNLVTLGPQPFAKFPKLKTLKLQSNKLEVLSPMAFISLPRLRNLDLSSNAILDLPNDLFKSLKNLETLDLSKNVLQSISGSFTQGLVKLNTLNLANNDIISLEPLQDISVSLTTLYLNSNPLDCSCSIKPFQDWLEKDCHSLSFESKRSVICETPRHFANAMLTKLDTTENCDDINYDIQDQNLLPEQPKVMSIPEEFQLLSKKLTGDELTLRWSLNTSGLNQDQIKCDQVELYKSDSEDSQSSFYSAPLNCQSENKTVLEAHFDLRKVGLHNIHPVVTSILACASILKNDTIEGLEELRNCTKIELNKNISTFPQASILSLEAKSESTDRVEVIYEVSPKSDCQISIQVEAHDPDDLGARVVASHRKGCQGQNFTFESLRVSPDDHLRVCAWLDFEFQHSDSKCTPVISIRPSKSKTYQLLEPLPHKKAPVLALVLTLVFLGIGIAALVVLYLIVKGYLSDRHKAELFQMRFCQLNVNNNVNQSPRHHPGASFWIQRWTHRFFNWRRQHRPVPASDEMVLREDSTFDTSVV